jgi:tetratricopeptide (TPR) repeat protein
MARYDRITPLSAPTREQAFPAWMTLRDLEGRERDADLARRARLRFLALRPVRRLLQHGFERVSAASYERQIEGVREELGLLSARDPERARLAEFLHRIRQRTPLALATATLDFGETIEGAGHLWAAEEFYFTALELSEAHRLVPQEIIAHRLLGRLCRKAGRWEEAADHYRRAADRALEAADHRQWARSMDGLATLFRLQGRNVDALRVGEEILAAGREREDDTVIAIGCAALCAAALAAGDLERAVEHGWTAVRLLPDDEDRYRLLAHLQVAFTRLGLFRAAERCCQIIASRSGHPAVRAQARADHALLAADAGNAELFRRRRLELLRQAAEWADEPQASAAVHLSLGRGCFLVGDTDFARDHLREAIAAAKRHGDGELLGRAEELLTALEQAATEALSPQPHSASPGPVARRIAAEVESIAETLVPATA